MFCLLGQETVRHIGPVFRNDSRLVWTDRDSVSGLKAGNVLEHPSEPLLHWSRQIEVGLVPELVGNVPGRFSSFLHPVEDVLAVRLHAETCTNAIEEVSVVLAGSSCFSRRVPYFLRRQG